MAPKLAIAVLALLACGAARGAEDVSNTLPWPNAALAPVLATIQAPGAAPSWVWWPAATCSLLASGAAAAAAAVPPPATATSHHAASAALPPMQACCQRRSRRPAVHAAAAPGSPPGSPQQPTSPQPGGAVGRFLQAFNSSPRSLEGMLACLAPDVAYHNLALAPQPFLGKQVRRRAGEGSRQAGGPAWRPLPPGALLLPR